MDAKQVLQHTLSLSNAMAVDELVETYYAAIQEFGCKYFLLTGLPSAEQRFDQLILERLWPEEWMSRYLSRDYVRYDPVVLTCISEMRPFAWQEAIERTSTYGPTADRIMMEAVDAGLRDGFCVPVVVRNALTGCISLASDAPSTNVDALPSLSMLSITFASRLQFLTGYKGRHSGPRLSEHEREVMRWVARGKTTWEISRILRTPGPTVNKRIVRAMRKLDCVNRIQAAAKAVMLMEIAV